MKSLSFDNMGALYDETRGCDPTCLRSALDYLVQRFPPADFPEVFEPGIGTGRIAIPLAERGYCVTGVDISKEMLAVLRDRLARADRSLPITYQEADATSVPFPDSAFDMAIAVHLFYFIQDWRRAAAELLRVVRKGGPVILMHTGTGAEIPMLNDRYRALCAEQGFPIKNVGVRSTKDVVAHFEGLGCRAEWIQDRWRWTCSLRLDKALRYIEARAYSFTTLAPRDVHENAISRLADELKHRFGALSAKVEVPNQIYIVILTRPA